MSMNIGLTPEQIIEVTGRKQGRLQIEALGTMGIEYRIRPNGTPFVALGAINEYTEEAIPKTKLNLSKL